MIGRISGQYSMDALSGKKAKKSVYYDEFSAGSDETAFSPFAMELARIDAELKNVPDVREDVVSRLKEQVEAGTYVPPLDKVAHSLVLAGMLNVQ
ncbi:MAG: flagellar biosynthesis anti-sigma factor FlgM [Synergistaceae bacterium]|nr:flagellar biosynthesis anti-sigma factor FlgM [Synergistaceae bacterium]